MKTSPLRTSVIGSYPFPGWLEFAANHLNEFGPDDLAEVQRDAVICAVKDQLDAGLDVKVTANRGHDCLCHRGIAKELSAILKLPLKYDPLRAVIELIPTTDAVSVVIGEPSLAQRRQ